MYGLQSYLACAQRFDLKPLSPRRYALLFFCGSEQIREPLCCVRYVQIIRGTQGRVQRADRLSLSLSTALLSNSPDVTTRTRALHSAGLGYRPRGVAPSSRSAPRRKSKSHPWWA
jgi:hypothetical protein